MFIVTFYRYDWSKNTQKELVESVFVLSNELSVGIESKSVNVIILMWICKWIWIESQHKIEFN